MNKYLTISFLFLLIAGKSTAQVYPYQPIDFLNTESNPSALASKKSDLLFNLNHSMSISSQSSFQLYGGSFSKYFEGLFLGTGINVGKVSLNDSTNYQYGSIGLGYRTVVFNKLFLKFGANFKHLQLSGNPVQHSFYHFEQLGTELSLQNEHNTNISITIGLPSDALYINAGVLNLPLSSGNSSFSRYSYINLGNLLRLIDKNTSSEMSYTSLWKGNSMSLNNIDHYLNMSFGGRLSRKAVLMIGGRFGWINQQQLHCTPMVGFERRFYYGLSRKSQMIQLKLGYDITYQTNDFSSITPAQIQTYLTYKF